MLVLDVLKNRSPSAPTVFSGVVAPDVIFDPAVPVAPVAPVSPLSPLIDPWLVHAPPTFRLMVLLLVLKNMSPSAPTPVPGTVVPEVIFDPAAPVAPIGP